MHVFIRVDRIDEFDNAMAIITEFNVHVFTLELDDMVLARQLRDRHLRLTSRDLCYLACCIRRGVNDMMTFDASLRQAFYST